MLAFFRLLHCIQTNCGDKMGVPERLDRPVFLACLLEPVRIIQNMGVPSEHVFNSRRQIDGNLGNVSNAFCSPPRGSELDLDGDDKDLQEVLEIEELQLKCRDVKVLDVV